VRWVERFRARMCREQAARVAELEARLDHERLFPVEWANRRVRDRFGERVQAGPFAGLRYPDWAFQRVDLYAPKLIGCFERELHPVIEYAIAAAPRLVVNVGAAEGYYTIGLARRLPAARVLAFEADESKHWMLDELARLNGVRDRIELLGACTPGALNERLEDGTLIVCDCDGCELELLDPSAVPALGTCALVVEAHDLLVEGLTPVLRGRFAATHALEEAPTEPRYVDDFPQLGDLPLVTRQLAISEFRGSPMCWLIMRPRRT
jgi:predicted O-methyltransferase YrrM